MNPGRRAFIGAIIGALVVLVGHPSSRPYLLGLFSAFGVNSTIRAIEPSPGGYQLPQQIANEFEAATWMLVGAERIIEKRVTDSDLKKLIAIAKRAGEIDTGNAYWMQMVSTFQWLQRNEKSAISSWLTASHNQRWDDHQSRRLGQIAENIAPEGGPSWRWAAVYPYHSTAPAQVIEAFSRHIVRTYRPTNELGTQIRYAVLSNGRLLRNGSRNLAVSAIGEGMIELSSFPPEMESQASPKRLLLARQELVNRLRESGMEIEANQAQDIFVENEAWMAMTKRENANEVFQAYATLSLFASTVGGLSLAVTALGFFILLFSRFLRSPILDRALVPPVPHILGILVGLGVYQLTGFVLPSVAACLSFAFLSFGPSKERSNPPRDLGPLFTLITFTLGCILAATFALFVLGFTSAGLHVGPAIGIPREYLAGSPVLAGLFIIGFCLMLLVAPSWGFVQRVSTASVLRRASERVGRGLIVGGLVCAVLLTPLSVYVDMRIGSSLEQIVANEPIFYYSG